MTREVYPDRPPSVMKMSITHGGVKASIFRADGEGLGIQSVLDQFVSPLLLSAGFAPEAIEWALHGERSVAAAVPAQEDGPWVRLPDVPEGFAFVGHFDGPYELVFSSEDLVYLGGFAWKKWNSCTTFGGHHPYAARIGSPAHAFALENFPPQS